jgi:beta-mannanase
VVSKAAKVVRAARAAKAANKVVSKAASKAVNKVARRAASRAVNKAAKVVRAEARAAIGNFKMPGDREPQISRLPAN